MRIIECAQHSEEWWLSRRGIPTASRFSSIITATGRPTQGKTRLGLIAELLADRVSLNPPVHSDHVIRGTQAMRNGVETEPEARRWYQIDHPEVRQAGFALTDDGRFGCSPDALVGDDGLLELKCPMAKTHMMYLMNGVMPGEYKAQVHGQLIVTGRAYVDFLSYSPGCDPFLVRVVPDGYTELLRLALDDFWTDYDAASRRQLNEPAPGVDPIAFGVTCEAFQRWLRKIKKPEEIRVDMLKDAVGDCKEPVKLWAWQQICDMALAQGWQWNKQTNKFEPVQVPAF